MALKASIVTATRNRAHYLELTLAAYTVQGPVDEYELILVNDGGDDETEEVVAKFSEVLPLRYEYQAHAGLAAARNAGLARATGEVIILTDDDRMPGPGFVAAHVRAYHTRGGQCVVLGKQHGIVSHAKPAIDSIMATIVSDKVDPRLRSEVLAVSGRLFEPEQLFEASSMVFSRYKVPEPYWVDCLEVMLDRYGENLTGFEMPWAIGATGNMSVPRALVERAGGFDGSFVGWGLEDTDFHYRVHQEGAKTVFALDAENYHQCHERPGRLKREWTKNLVRLHDKFRNLDICAFVCALHNVGIGYKAFEQMSDVLAELRERRHSSPKLAVETERLLTAHAALLLRAAVVY